MLWNTLKRKCNPFETKISLEGVIGNIENKDFDVYQLIEDD